MIKKRLLIVTVISILFFSLGIITFAQSNTVKIGLSAPITGNYAEYGEMIQNGVQIAADEINAKGGIRGKKIEIVIRDSEGNPARATSIAQEFVNNPGIVAEIGDFTSTACMAAAPIYESAGLVQLSPSASHPDFASLGDYMFSIDGRTSGETLFLARAVFKNHFKCKSVAVVHINNDWGVATMENFVKAAEEQGLIVTGIESHMEAETDFSALLTNLKRGNPDALFIADMYNEASQIVRQIEKMGWDIPKAGSNAIYSEEFLELAGKAAEGLITTTPFDVNEDREVVKNFVAEFEKRTGKKPVVYAAEGYDCMNLLAQAMEKNGFNRKDIRDALAATGTYVGATGEFTLFEIGDVLREYLLLIVADNEWKLMK